MRVEWHGQSAFTLEGEEATVFVDPFGEMDSLRERGIEWSYPPIAADGVDLLLVSHEHRDHNAVEAIAGEPAMVRSLAGTFETPVGTVVGVSSEHDDAAGSARGHNSIFVFELDGLRIAHFGVFGQAALRPEQTAAIREVDLVFVPVGGGPTIGAEQAADIAGRVQARWIVPMHYRTPRINFLAPVDDFASRFEHVARLDTPRFELDELPGERPLVIVPAAP
jgi:L-ascorbate metabolism protein UlaG (beta-lactamase superfamily)